jgi:hypothetical protein
MFLPDLFGKLVFHVLKIQFVEKLRPVPIKANPLKAERAR